MLIASSFPAVVFIALGAWASVIAISGGVAGFIALLSGRPIDEVVQEVALGSVAAVPAGFCLAVAALFLAG